MDKLRDCKGCMKTFEPRYYSDHYCSDYCDPSKEDK